MDPLDPPRPSGLSETIERALALVLFAGLLLGILATLRPFATAILFGSILAIALWPLRRALVARGLGRGATAAILLLLMLVVVVAPLLALAPGLVEAVETLILRGRAAIEAAAPNPPAWLAELPLVGDRVQRLWATAAAADGDLQATLAPYGQQIRAALLSVAEGVVGSAVQLLLSLVVAAMVWTTGDAIAATLALAAGRLGGATGLRSLDAAAAAVRAVAYGVVGTAAVQGVLAAVGFAIAGVPGAGLLGFLILVFSVSQILGPLIIVTWGGAAWWLFQQGATGWAIFMALWGLVVISGSDNVVRPLLISRGMEMPLSIIILGVFGGFVSFGFLGLFIGPTLLAVGYVLLQAWRGAPPAAAAP